ncbi:MAG TPA: Zn-ribbon domain-containing OB-fold protein [Anaerolineales bacterium]|nr:Zn-ribbon domain-containing OB-fold protein [Anaerolineales bacterium]
MSLLERDPHIPFAWQDNMPVASRYTAGVAGERFFRAIKDEGRILGTYCPACDHTYVPAALFCERCLDELDEWVDMGTTGEVFTYTLLYESYDGTSREDPEIVAFIRMGDGGLIHRLGEVDPDAISIGMQVEAVFKPAGERQGNIQDISHFKPVA